MRRLSFVALAVAVTACSDTTAVCNAIGWDGLDLSVVDARTGASLADAATVTVADVAHPEVRATGSLVEGRSPLDVAESRAGTYEVTVVVPGYRTWTQRATVTGSIQTCTGGETVALTARLEPDA
jgi:hypothetical protein